MSQTPAAPEPELFGHSEAPVVLDAGVQLEAVDSQLLERILDDGRCGLRHEPAPAQVRAEPVTDFRAREHGLVAVDADRADGECVDGDNEDPLALSPLLVCGLHEAIVRFTWLFGPSHPPAELVKRGVFCLPQSVGVAEFNRFEDDALGDKGNPPVVHCAVTFISSWMRGSNERWSAVVNSTAIVWSPGSSSTSFVVVEGIEMTVPSTKM